MGLSDLSTELLLCIISELPPASFPGLSLTNRRLHQVTNPRLYESIYFRGKGEENHEGKLFEDGVCFGQKAPLDAVRIYDLELLTQSLQHTPSLSSQIKRAELFWGADEGMEDEGKVLRFLSNTKHARLERLVLSPLSLYFPVPTHVAVTSLRIRHDVPRAGCENDLALDLDQLHKQCCIPSLHEVSVDGWLYWSESVMDASPRNTAVNAPLERAKTSPITILRISTVGAPGHVFNDVLGWPKTLRVFHFECEPVDQYQMPGRVSTADFIKPLQHCCGTLEELSIRCCVGINDPVDTSRPINLRAFPTLKRLRISFDFLIRNRTVHRFAVEHREQLPKLFEVLPPSLEQLHLEIGDNEFRIWEIDSNTIVSEDVYWFLDTLEELAMRKAEYLPHLTTVVSGESPNFDYDYNFWDIVNECDRGAQVKAAFAREHIRFSCWSSDEQPRVFDD